MLRTLAFSSLVAAALLLLTPDGVFGQKKKDNNDKGGEKATAQEVASLLNIKQIAGSVFYVDPAAKTITLRVEIPTYNQPNANNNNANNNNPNPNPNNNLNNNMYR